VKSNIGHLEAASGLAGIAKCIQILEKGLIPPNSLFEKLNPAIDAESLHVQVPTRQCIPWPTLGLRRVSVNSFGFGGTNSHAVLDDALHYLQSRGLTGYHNGVDYPVAVRNRMSNGHNDGHINRHQHGHGALARPNLKLLVWSAADMDASQRMGRDYQSYYADRIAASSCREKVDRLAYTLAARRTVMPWRTFALVDADRHHGELNISQPLQASTDKKAIAFVFTGQGAQYAGMGMELLRYPAFRDSLGKSDGLLASLGCKWSIFDIINDPEKVNKPESSQPLCTVLQIALVALLRSFGITPAAVLGHSSGEIAAAYTVGALSHESACMVAYYRGQVAQKLGQDASQSLSLDRRGAMMSVNLSEHQVASYLQRFLGQPAGHGGVEDAVHVACVNSPTNVTLSASSHKIDILKAGLDKLDIFAHKIETGGIAYHSPQMAAVAQEYLDLMGGNRSLLGSGALSRPPVVMVSSVTGQIVAPKRLAMPQYWVDNLLSPVRFANALARFGEAASMATDSPVTTSLLLHPGSGLLTDLIEIGPHGALRRPVRDTLDSQASASASALRYHCILERKKSPLRTSLELMGTLFCHGHPVSVLSANFGSASKSTPDGQSQIRLQGLVDCPPYPFDHRRRYWNEPRFSKDYRFRPPSSGYLLGRRSHDWNPLQPKWRNRLSIETIPWLADHVVSDWFKVVFLGTILLAHTLTVTPYTDRSTDL